MTKIKEITAREILDAKGFPTVEATVILSDGKIGVASSPRGNIFVNYEAVDLKDNDEKRFGGFGVLNAVNNIKSVIAPSLVGRSADRQLEIDKIMIDLDGTQNKARIGANAMLAVSMALSKAAAESSALPLFLYLRQFVKKNNDFLKIPTPIFNLINGTRDENGFSDFYEFLVIPASSKPYTESIQIGENIFGSLKRKLEPRDSKTLNSYEEGFTPNLATNKEAFSFILQAAADAQIRIGFDVFLGLDSRASILFKDGKYRIKDSPKDLSSKDLINYYIELNKEVHLLYLEDPLDQNDWEGWVELSAKLSQTTIIVGGDLVATNPFRLQMALDKKTISGIVIKPSQVGTVTESLAIAQIAKEKGLKIVVSHRAEETNDDFIADFSVAVGADYIKIGNLTRGENIAKYNRLLQIENQLRVL